jgi:hypothetical protein
VTAAVSAAGGGTVSSVAFSGGTTGLSASGSPITTSGTITLSGTLIAANGGTGQSSYTVGDILYASTTSALSKLADVATGSALISGGVGTAPSWGKIGLTTHVSGTLPVANGGTGTTTSTGTGSAVLSASPTFTGTPAAPTASPGTNTTQIATTAFVTAAVSAAGGGTVTSVAFSGGTTGLTVSGSPITSSGTFTLSGTLGVANGGTGITSFGTGVATALGVNTGSTGAFVVQNGALGTPSSGTLSGCTVDGTNSVGYRNIPQLSKSANYTFVLGDAGYHLYHPSSDNNARTFTIPANASVAFPIGTALTFVNRAATDSSIAITSDTMYLAGTGTTGTRTLAQYGVATAIKTGTTEWMISGTGLT